MSCTNHIFTFLRHLTNGFLCMLRSNSRFDQFFVLLFGSPCNPKRFSPSLQRLLDRLLQNICWKDKAITITVWIELFTIASVWIFGYVKKYRPTQRCNSVVGGLDSPRKTKIVPASPRKTKISPQEPGWKIVCHSALLRPRPHLGQFWASLFQLQFLILQYVFFFFVSDGLSCVRR